LEDASHLVVRLGRGEYCTDRERIIGHGGLVNLKPVRKRESALCDVADSTFRLPSCFGKTIPIHLWLMSTQAEHTARESKIGKVQSFVGQSGTTSTTACPGSVELRYIPEYKRPIIPVGMISDLAEFQTEFVSSIISSMNDLARGMFAD
jgi:hypothetical protein